MCFRRAQIAGYLPDTQQHCPSLKQAWNAPAAVDWQHSRAGLQRPRPCMQQHARQKAVVMIRATAAAHLRIQHTPS
jgi:hypothetical protein